MGHREKQLAGGQRAVTSTRYYAGRNEAEIRGHGDAARRSEV